MTFGHFPRRFDSHSTCPLRYRESSKLMSERYGRILGYSLLDKPGGYGDIVEVKTLKEYKLQQTLTVEEAMANTVRRLPSKQYIS